MSKKVVYYLSLIKDDAWYCTDTPSVKLDMTRKINLGTVFTKKEGTRIGSTFFKVKCEVLPVKLAALLKGNFFMKLFLVSF